MMKNDKAQRQLFREALYFQLPVVCWALLLVGCYNGRFSLEENEEVPGRDMNPDTMPSSAEEDSDNTDAELPADSAPDKDSDSSDFSESDWETDNTDTDADTEDTNGMDTDLVEVNCEDGYSFVDDNLALILSSYDLETVTKLSSTGGYDVIIRNLEGIQCLTTMETLELYYHQFQSIEPIGGMQNLAVLALIAPFADLSPLAGLSSLRSLSLTGLFDNLDPLYGLAGLQSLSLHGNFTDISALAQMKELETLDLSDNGMISDISSIADAVELTFLNLSGNEINDLSALSRMTRLAELNLSANMAADLLPLAANSALIKLNIVENFIADLEPIRSHTDLSVLEISRNWVSDLSPLSVATKLTSLQAAENIIGNLSPLAALAHLEKLDLGNNMIASLTGLESLRALTTLNLEGNAVRDLHALSGLTTVLTLRLSDNPLSDLGGIEGMTGLEVVYLNDCILRDLTPLIDNPGIGGGDWVFLNGNPLLCADGTSVGQLKTLIRRGVRVEHDCELLPDEDTDSGSESDIELVTDTDSDTEIKVDPWPEVAPTALADVRYLLNPYDTAPLSAMIIVSDEGLVPEAVSRMEITVGGQGVGGEDLVAEVFPQTEGYKNNFDMSDRLLHGEFGIPVLGLYPASDNEVRFRFTDGQRIFEGEVVIPVVDAVSGEGDTVIISAADPDRMEPGFTYLNGRMYDRLGNLRWVGPRIYRILRNGNYLAELNEMNWLGKTVVNRTLPRNLDYHDHETIELPGGNVIAAVSNKDTLVVNPAGLTVTSIEDYLVEMDKESNIVNAWDLRDYLDVSRGTVSFRSNDWAHVNTLTYDATDDSILVSCRYQGIIKLTRGGIQGPEPNVGKDLQWIFGPHLGWGLSGWNGEGLLDTNLYLLLATDLEGTPYPDDVQKNLAAPTFPADDFYWPVGQHGLYITSRTPGKISFFTFNNQASFVFDGVDTLNNGVTSDTQGDLSNDRSPVPFSQIAEYEIDENNMTVRQLWGFGENQPEWYGSRACGVNLLKKTGNRMLISTGGDQHDPAGEVLNPHIVEIAELEDVVFHLEIENTDLSAYRAGRVDLYHPGGSN